MKLFSNFNVLAFLALCFCFFLTFAAVAADVDIPVDSFLAQVFAAVKDMGGMTGAAKISAVIMIIVASTKVSFLRSLIWDKLGWAKALVGPVLGFVGALILVQPLTFGAAFAWVLTGFGAQNLHELLDALKGIPGIGSGFVAVIDFISKILGGNSSLVNKTSAAALLK